MNSNLIQRLISVILQEQPAELLTEELMRRDPELQIGNHGLKSFSTDSIAEYICSLGTVEIRDFLQGLDASDLGEAINIDDSIEEAKQEGWDEACKNLREAADDKIGDYEL